MSRVELDQYFTPPELARVLVDTLPIGQGDTVLEPSAGHYAFVQALLEKTVPQEGPPPPFEEEHVPPGGAWHQTPSGERVYRAFRWVHYVVAVDIQIQPRPSELAMAEYLAELHLLEGDFLTLECPTVDWVVGNPPYGQAQAHVEKALQVAKRGVALLLRLCFLESLERRDFWQRYPPASVSVLSPRPSFTPDGGTDGQAYAWFVWDKLQTRQGPSQLSSIYWEKARRSRKPKKSS